MKSCLTPRSEIRILAILCESFSWSNTPAAPRSPATTRRPPTSAQQMLQHNVRDSMAQRGAALLGIGQERKPQPLFWRIHDVCGESIHAAWMPVQRDAQRPLRIDDPKPQPVRSTLHFAVSRCSFSDQMPKFFISFAEVEQLGVYSGLQLNE